MDTVERIREICKRRKIPISKLERDLGFANAYIAQLKRGVIRGDRLAAIADYLGVSTDYLLTGEEKKPLVSDDEELTELLERVRDDPHLRMLFSITKDATPEDIEKAIKIIQTLKGE